MDNNMFSEMMFAVLQSNISDLVERIIPDKLPKMKSIRTHEWVMDKEIYAETQDVALSMYCIHDGYNMEVSKLFVQVMNHINESCTNQNVKWAFDVMKNYIPNKLKSMNQKPIKYEKPTKRSKPTPKLPGRPKQIVIDFQIECKECKDVKDIRTDFYKGRLVCKSCYSKQVVKARQA